MEKLNIKDLIVGEIYVTETKYPGYIFKHNGTETTCYIDSRGTPSYGESGNLNASTNDAFSDYRHATDEEKAWLKACMEAHRIVEKPDLTPRIKENYEIY